MNNSNDKSNLLKEISIFEYVSGNQSEAAKRNFEQMMKQDPSLEEAVQAEQRLRLEMKKAGQLKPVSMDNFEDLLATINTQENSQIVPLQEQTMTATADNSNIEDNTVHHINSGSFAKPYAKYYAMAASVAFIGLFFAGFIFSNSPAEFETLSDTQATDKINFAQLTESGRLAKLTFEQNISQQQIDGVLREYSLTSFESGSNLDESYVIAESSISQNDLALWRSDARIASVELFVTSAKQ